MSYLQYVNAATTALRNTVKPTLAARYAIKEDVHYKKQAWVNGKPQEKVYFTGSQTMPVRGYQNPTGHLAGADAVPATLPK